jgi:protein TonB
MFPSLDIRTPEVFSVSEIARAAGVRRSDVRTVLRSSSEGGSVPRFLPLPEAVRLVRALGSNDPGWLSRPIFAAPPDSRRHSGMPLAASGALHAAALAVMVLVASLGVRTAPAEEPAKDPVRLVFLATPGPGGGGGGGGLRQPRPAAKALLRGKSRVDSPVTVSRSAERRPEPAPAPPRPVVPEPTRDPIPEIARATPIPPIVAPVVTAPADAQDRPGVVTGTTADARSNGPGTGGGSGTGTGTGSGEGNGAGIGEGSIAGTGGGPYRPGSGITPPRLLREVKPDYTEEGRTRHVEGDVVLEVVVRSDGGVGGVRVLQGLGSGLESRAIEAVRQWKFSPALRFGKPVDVLVEVAVEFRLR